MEESDSLSDLSEADCREDHAVDTNQTSLNTSATEIAQHELFESLQFHNQSNAEYTKPKIDTNAYVNRAPPCSNSVDNALLTGKGLQGAPWHGTGRLYRLCCFSSVGIKVIIFLNLLLICMNSTLIVYEAWLMVQHNSIVNTPLPMWYMIVDIIVTCILFVEMCSTVAAIHSCNVYNYFTSGCHATVDVLILLLSIACCFAYYFDLTDQDIDNALILVTRVIRDVIRIVRCLWFFKMLYSNLIHLEDRRKSSGTNDFRGQSLLGHKAWNAKYQLQINSSPRSAESDQRDYRRPKRVGIYDETDIERMMKAKDKEREQRQKYSCTPSPPPKSRRDGHNSSFVSDDKSDTSLLLDVSSDPRC